MVAGSGCNLKQMPSHHSGPPCAQTHAQHFWLFVRGPVAHGRPARKTACRIGQGLAGLEGRRQAKNLEPRLDSRATSGSTLVRVLGSGHGQVLWPWPCSGLRDLAMRRAQGPAALRVQGSVRGLAMLGLAAAISMAT